MSIGKYLDKILMQRKIPKNRFAKQLGLSDQQLHSILYGNSLSKLETLRKASALLDVPTDFFLQDFGKQFLVFAIDDYCGKIDKAVARAVLRDAALLLGGETDDE